MIPNSCVIDSIAKAYNLSALSIHRTALAIGVDCRPGGVTTADTIRILRRLKARGKTPVIGLSIDTVMDDTLGLHAILGMGNNTFWCTNLGYMKPLDKTYILQESIDLNSQKVKSITYDSIQLMKYCNANCKYRISHKKVLNWFDQLECPIEQAIKHILYYRHIRGY